MHIKVRFMSTPLESPKQGQGYIKDGFPSWYIRNTTLIAPIGHADVIRIIHPDGVVAL